MIFTVIWKPPAENQLAVRWMSAPDRNVVARAGDMIDALLNPPLPAWQEKLPYPTSGFPVKTGYTGQERRTAFAGHVDFPRLEVVYGFPPNICRG